MRRLVVLLMGMLLMLLITSSCTFLKNFGPTLNPYTCESGAKVEVKYPSSQTAYVYYKSKRYRLRGTSESGVSTYSNGRYQWQVHGTGPGSKGTLARVEDGEPQQPPMEVCIEDD